MEKRLINEGATPQFPHANVEDQAIPQETRQIHFGTTPQITQIGRSVGVERDTRESFEEAMQRRSTQA